MPTPVLYYIASVGKCHVKCFCRCFRYNFPSDVSSVGKCMPPGQLRPICQVFCIWRIWQVFTNACSIPLGAARGLAARTRPAVLARTSHTGRSSNRYSRLTPAPENASSFLPHTSGLVYSRDHTSNQIFDCVRLRLRLHPWRTHPWRTHRRLRART